MATKDRIQDLSIGDVTKVLKAGMSKGLIVGKDEGGFYLSRPDKLARSRSYKAYKTIPERKAVALRKTMKR